MKDFDKKIYLVYLHIPNEIYNKTNGLSFIYNHFDYDNTYWTGLYGYTANKKKLKKFMLIHNPKYFKVKSITNDHPKYEKILEELRQQIYYNMKIDNHEFETTGGKVKLTTTQFEYHLCASNEMLDDALQFVCNKVFTSDIISHMPEPCLFKKDIYASLVKMGYEYIYYTYCYIPHDFDNEDDYQTENLLDADGRYEKFMYNSGFGLNMKGDMKSFTSDPDQLNAFIVLFGTLLEVK